MVCILVFMFFLSICLIWLINISRKVKATPIVHQIYLFLFFFNYGLNYCIMGSGIDKSANFSLCILGSSIMHFSHCYAGDKPGQERGQKDNTKHR